MPINVDRLVAAQGSFEPMRQNNAIISFNVGSLGMDNSLFWVALKSFPYPKEESAKKTIRWFNESRHYAGSVVDFGAITLQIRDYLDQAVAQRLIAWRRLVWEPATANVGLARNYKASGMIYLFPPGNSTMDFSVTSDTTLSRTVYLEGCFPLTFDMGAFDMDSDGEQVLISADISVDRAYAGTADGTSTISAFSPLNLGNGASPSLAGST